MLVRGGGGTGKSHLLAALCLLLRHPLTWAAFGASHPGQEALRERLAGRQWLVVTVPLAEHRGRDEHLEDVVFDCTEAALRAPRYGVAVPLSERSHALDLIDRHVVPRYERELETYVRHHAHGTGWEKLRERAPDQAVQLARQFAQEIGYPLDFRQSRVERLSRLLEIVREHRLSGIVWLLDDLSEFLTGADPKAAHGDWSFLDFVGQRCKIAPLYVVGALDQALEQVGLIEPYLLNAIRASYRTDLVLTPELMRRVARRRVIGRLDPDNYTAAISQVRQAYQDAFGFVSFTEDELGESYPILPVALRSLESIAGRYFSASDTLVAFLQDILDQTSLAGVFGRDFRQPIGVDDIFDYLRPRISSHPEVSAYVYDVLDYFQKNAAEVYPEAPELCVRLARALIAFRLANVAAPVSLLVESLGLDAAGGPVTDVPTATRVLEAMRLAGSFVDVRRGAAEGPVVYVVDVRVSLTETARRRITATKAAFEADSPKLWQHVMQAADEVAFPLHQLTDNRTLEVQWQNTFRCLSAQLVDLGSFTAASFADYVSDLADPATVEDAHLFVARPSNPRAQAEAWHSLRAGAPASRWSASMLAWLPRELSAQELDGLKEFAAVAELLEDEAALSAESGLRDQLAEFYAPLTGQVRKTVRAAYYEGQVLTPYGAAVTAGELSGLSGDWSGTLEAITGRAFERVFPEFPAIAPRRPLVAHEQVDALVDQVIRPGRVQLAQGDPLRDLVTGILEPLGLAVYRDGEHIIDVGRSKAAEEVMARVRQRDQTPVSQTGRALSCSDLAQHLVKAPVGLPPELFELVVAALIRTGYLAPMRDRVQMVRLEDVATPISGSVHYVARPPLLGPAQWQALARISRAILESLPPAADYGAQMRVWERLVAARAEWLDQIGALRRRLDTHIEELDQRPFQWREALADIDALERSFQCIRPELPPALGLAEYVRDMEEATGDAAGWQRLMGLFRRMEALTAYLERVAPDVVAMRNYLLSPDLNIETGGDLDTRRQAIMELIGTAQELPEEEPSLRRQAQIFFAAYKRRYVSWHGRAYRSPVFDQYRLLHQAPEMRALNQLSRVRLDVNVTAEDVARRVDSLAARRCTRADLGEVLEHQPACPDCGLRLDEDPEIVPPEALLEEARQALRGYAMALQEHPLRERLVEHAESMPRRGELAQRLVGVAELGPDPAVRDVLTLFTEDTIPHVNRVLSGKRLAPRNLGELRDALQGRTVSRDEAHRLFDAWLAGGEPEPESDEMLQIDD
jgi:hypothetical protein